MLQNVVAHVGLHCFLSLGTEVQLNLRLAPAFGQDDKG